MHVPVIITGYVIGYIVLYKIICIDNSGMYSYKAFTNESLSAVTIVARLEISITISISVPCFNGHSFLFVRNPSCVRGTYVSLEIFLSNVNSQTDFSANGSFDPIDM